MTVDINRYAGGSNDEVVPLVREWKKFLESSGAKSVMLSKIYSGPNIGDWLFIIQYEDWTTYGKCRDALDAMYRDSTEFKDLFDRTVKMQNIHKIVERTLVVEVNV
jgi:hypothetical protein